VSSFDAAIGRGTRAAEAALWACAGVVMLTVHVGGAAWLLRAPSIMVAEDSPPAAIMIELAPEPEAVFTEANEIAPDLQTTESSAPADEAPKPEEAPVEEVAEEIEPDPVEEGARAYPVERPEAVEEAVAAVEEDAVALPDAVDVPLPIVRAKPPEAKTAVSKRETLRKPVRQNRQQRAASTSATQAQAQVTHTDRNAGRQSASGSASTSPARWQSRLMAHLERRKRYPSAARSRGEQGTVHVRFSIDGGGNVLSVTLARSSGFPDLDNEVLSLVRRVSPVPSPPPGSATSITVPIRFSVR
jgi:periplasmic protein TonB